MSILRTGIPGAGVVPVSASGTGALGAANPWWDPNGEGLCVWGAWLAKGAANMAASLLDLTGNGNNLIDPGGINSPGWNAVNGWIFDGANDYLDTNFMCQVDQSQSMLIQFSNMADQDCIAGMSQGGDEFSIKPNIFTALIRYQNGNNHAQRAPNLLAGNLGIAGNQGYRNGVADGGALPAWGGAGPIFVPLALGCRWTGAVTNPAAVDEQAAVVYDCALTGPQMLAVAIAMAAL